MILPFKKLKSGLLWIAPVLFSFAGKTNSIFVNAVQIKKGEWKEAFDSEFLAK